MQLTEIEHTTEDYEKDIGDFGYGPTYVVRTYHHVTFTVDENIHDQVGVLETNWAGCGYHALNDTALEAALKAHPNAAIHCFSGIEWVSEDGRQFKMVWR